MDRLLGFLARRAVLSILLVLFAVFTVLQRSIFLSEQNMANVARQVSFNGIIALGAWPDDPLGNRARYSYP